MINDLNVEKASILTSCPTSCISKMASDAKPFPRNDVMQNWDLVLQRHTRIAKMDGVGEFDAGLMWYLLCFAVCCDINCIAFIVACCTLAKYVACTIYRHGIIIWQPFRVDLMRFACGNHWGFVPHRLTVSDRCQLPLGFPFTRYSLYVIHKTVV